MLIVTIIRTLSYCFTRRLYVVYKVNVDKVASNVQRINIKIQKKPAKYLVWVFIISSILDPEVSLEVYLAKWLTTALMAVSNGNLRCNLLQSLKWRDLSPFPPGHLPLRRLRWIQPCLCPDSVWGSLGEEISSSRWISTSDQLLVKLDIWRHSKQTDQMLLTVFIRSAEDTIIQNTHQTSNSKS